MRREPFSAEERSSEKSPAEAEEGARSFAAAEEAGAVAFPRANNFIPEKKESRSGDLSRVFFVETSYRNMSPKNARSVDAYSVAFGEVHNDGGRVTVPLAEPLRVVTDVAELVNHLSDAEGNVNPFLTVKFRNQADADFFAAFESRVVAAAKENREAWFAGSPDDEKIETSLKAFSNGKNLKIRANKNVEAFNADGTQADVRDVFANDAARFLLSAKEVKIGKVEYGIVWTLEQLRVAKKTTCIIDDDPSDAEYDIDDMIV